MKKILINLYSESLTIEDFDYFTNEIPIDFEVFNYQFSVEEMFPDIVEAIINNILKDLDISLINTSFILQTNVADLGHFSAKFYAELLDAVIIVTKNVELLTDTQKDFNFILKVLRADMMNLRLHKVFIHEKDIIDLKYLKFLYLNRLFNEIIPVSNLELVKVEKLRYDAVFIIDESSIETNFSLKDKSYFQCRDINPEEDSISYIFEAFGMYKLLQFIMDIELFSIEDKIYYLQSILTHAVRVEKKTELLDYIVKYMDLNVLSLQKFADYNYFCMLLGEKDTLMRLYTFLKKNYNELNPIQVHALITNSLTYEAQLNQAQHDDLVKDRLLLMERINQFLQKKIQLPKIQKRANNRFAIIAGQLLSIYHAPTKWALDYANMLKKYNPDFEIKIFVDDWANYSPGELTWMCTFSSANSATFHLEHKEYLHAEIEVYYSNSNLERKKRIQQDINAISMFQPSIIYKMGSKYNLAVDLLYPYFPIISHTMGGAEDCNFVDIFTGGYHENVMNQMYNEINIFNQQYYYQRIGIETPKSIETKNRTSYKLSDSDFVLITVGNRLESEITKEFLHQIIETMEANKDIKWLIVGAKNISLINNSYENYINENRIMFIPYENQLFDLYNICDIYVNPVRQTGGTSAAWAMKAKLPIITSNPASDVAGFCGEENCIDIDLFSQEILQLKNDKSYYIEKSNEMFNRIENDYSFEKTNEDLKQIFEIAIQKFEKRNKDK